MGLCVASAGAAFAMEGAKPADKFTALRSLQAPKVLAEEDLAKIEGQAITLLNPGGQTPQGGGANNGQAIQAVNPSGFAPPGQNK